MIENKIIIWGADNSHALGVIRQLGKSNLDVLFLVNGRSNGYASKSKYCKKIVFLSNVEKGFNYLLSNYKDKSNKAILLLMGDEVAEVVDKNREKLLPYFFLSGTSEQGLLSKIDDKNIMSEIAKRHGFTIPKSVEFKWNSRVDNIEYPCIVKPTALATGRLDFKSHICWSENDLIKMTKLMNHGNKYILQQYIPKEYDLFITGYRKKNGEVVLAGTYYKDRWSDDGGASHGYIVPDIPEYTNPKGIESFLREIDYYGLFSVEYGLYKGVAYFYEFNLRNDGTSHIFYQCGANLPLSWIYDCIDYENNVPIKVEGKKYAINEVLDQINIVRGKVSRKQWEKDRLEASAFYFYDPEDLVPWKVAKRTAWFNRAFRSFLLKYRPLIVYWLDKLK
ncbi:hypothetical protein HMPREF1062_03724 [Bacteroides cellulosilyticus CL02T12C19]|jgi:hypothetical protein|uniref:ATP-grasp domain-containing protein n=1 Tax=Bacteroides cellulosilyticus CL02T12C19 TaxID=997874 RepID=I9F3H3_9BACE|nr:hypothetical protein [Bacteroides cellulosilyticus]EIY27469.1 hypothetical protein HMPREF1062_03724 [Bacteroides cellulosilyticus CL02T12C19]